MNPDGVPTISVLLPTYNGAAFLRAALDSILGQSFTDFELIVVDDGSVDATPELLKGYRDVRLRTFRQKNQGLARSLNFAIAAARAPLLARQDADDIALPGRFEKQVAYLQAHPDVAVVGTAAQIWVGDRPDGRFHRHPCDPLSLAFEMHFDNYMVHSSVMMRRSAIDEVGVYTTLESRRHEDFELWSRMSRRFKMANLPEVLQVYREHPGSMCRTEVFESRCIGLAAENIAMTVGSPNVEPVHQALAALLRGGRPAKRQIPLAHMEQILEQIAAVTAHRFDLAPAALADRLAMRMRSLRNQFHSQTLPRRIRAVPGRVVRKLGRIRRGAR